VNKTKKILFVGNYEKSVGGISGQIEILRECLLKEEITAEIFTTKRCILVRFFLIFLLVFKASRYHILHIHGCSYVGGFFPIVIGTISGKLLKKKTIVTYHGGEAAIFFKKYPGFIKYFFSLADEITVQSGFLEDVFANYGIKVNVIPNILNFEYAKFRQREIIRPVLIVTRSLNRIYNIECAIRAFDIIKMKYHDASLIIVGDGPEMINLKNLVKNMNLVDVYFKGRVPNNNIFDELNEADIFVNPTTKDNMPVSVLEALACGLPVVSTNVGGIPKIIKDRLSGLLVDNNDHAEMATRITELIENHSLFKAMILNGVGLLERHKWHSVRDKWYALYEISDESQ